ncbi:polysaccharide pyruvyl transferase family protein [Butyrivibrio fibrisolvens]|uniref:polysaccharide pyruvyl transferase family protein n=1 Tax=Butyrivibrio fibrisolvens TaxID=831 RepID=UPI0003F90338|nr:polysaccharide pyruvyl transferase family protein [Butyrivibrio fibrisolvens]
MKAAIVTLTKQYNYGNSLQNYAVQTVLQRLGIEAETILYDFRPIKKRITQTIKGIINWNAPEIKRKRAFDCFEKQHINISPIKNLVKKSKFAERRYDYFLVGSDQVWNPSWYRKHMDNVYLLDFTTDDKKISYAPSFGIEKLPDIWESRFANGLKQFKAISVREEAGVNIVRTLTGITPIVVIDPTMMISAGDWSRISKRPDLQLEEKYILTYFLGDTPSNVQELCFRKQNDYQTVELKRVDDDKTIDPSEFLWLVEHAQLVLTDSFHACVFSFLFNKPFQVYDRQDAELCMNSRLDSFLRLFGLERKYVGSGLDNDIWENDYKKGYAILEQEIEKAKKYLIDSLGIS